MKTRFQNLGIIISILAVIALAMGAAFIQQGFAKEAFLVKAMTQEQITVEGVEGIVDTAEEAQLAADTIREHRHGIAPTYGDLLGGGRFNPTDPKQLSYGQALTLETYLYLAVASFGIFNVVKATGTFMLLTGVALGATGYGLISISRK